MIRICVEMPAPGATAREHDRGGAPSCVKENDAPRELPSGHAGEIDIDHSSADRCEHRRWKMIRDTERYLNDPHSTPWARLSRARANGLARAWKSTCATGASASGSMH